MINTQSVDVIGMLAKTPEDYPIFHLLRSSQGKGGKRKRKEPIAKLEGAQCHNSKVAGSSHITIQENKRR